ncbi:amino acid ABC transporter permease [Salinicoccus albus]|uniref:amino acid ABC transporter permease n=1 Tax=Salinicoccus albus TaxID=418756 RepID=UPI000364D1BA|nr:amino acid ABC transporter permease [Salinicoccus albus]
MFDISVVFESIVEIIKVVPFTLFMAFLILIFSLILGSFIAWLESKYIPVIHQILIVIKSFIRGTPNVVLLFLIYYSFPFVVAEALSYIGIELNPYSLNPVVVVIVTFSVCYAAFQSEIIKGALHALDKHQVEASQSLGYSQWQTLRKVIIPQVMAEALPDTMNTLLLIIKALSLAFLVTVVDIFAQANLVGAMTFSYLEAFTAAALIYWVLGGAITYATKKVENHLNRGYV